MISQPSHHISNSSAIITKKIRRVAAATEWGIIAYLPAIIDHFVDAEVRHFDYNEKDKALEWLVEAMDETPD